MRVKSFLKLVEIQTKVASVIPFVLGLLYAHYRFEAFRPQLAIVMFISLLAVDMATTAINNYMDYRRAIVREGYGFSEHNGIVRDRLPLGQVKRVIALLILVGIVFGLWLVYLTDWIVLVLGVLSFAMGILYSYGPVPISRTPLGEAVSGGFMGILIPFITVYTQVPAGGLMSFSVDWSTLSLRLAWLEILLIGLYSLPLFCGIANIMLANNICDRAEDIANQRYTLVHFIGNKKALCVFEALYVLAIISFNLLIVSAVLPVWNLVYNFLIITIWRGVKTFKARQIKAETFHIAVDNFVRIGLMIIVLMAANILLEKLL